MEQQDEPSAPTWRPITASFDAHARQTPDAVAVETEAGSRSYAELAARVDRLAARLVARLGEDGNRDEGGERLIGVCLERDLDLPAWLLAILKIGAAYCPIDPSLPPQRLAPMLGDARPALIVVARRFEGVVAFAGVPTMLAEDDDGRVLPPAPVVPIAPDRLAYVIFTSGSTGRPKGVEIEHRSLAALMDTMAASPGLAAGERMLGITRISFDLSVPDLFLPFRVGAALVVVPLEVATDPDRLVARIARHRPDLMQATPSTWRALLEAGWSGLDGLRIVAGGETVTRALADRLLPRCAELWNIYGPTETTVWSTATRVGPGGGPVPIGWPMTGAEVQVLGGDLRPVAEGEVGEIVIGGTGVARGYRERPALTADRFVTVAGGRAYRTGDLGRFDADGALFCLGRMDDQVKVRGFRIELGDVEAALAADPHVAWSAARLWPDPSGEPALVGYVVGRDGHDPAGGSRAFLATRLAPYMIPDRVVALAAMPLTPNGKVDRAALPDPFVAPREEAPAQDGTADGETAGGETATRLAAIWCDLLGLAHVDGADDFFALGGYSLMTVRLVRRIEAAFGERLPLIEMMRHPTLTAMAARIDRGRSDGSEPMLLAGNGDRPPLFWLDAGPLIRNVAEGMPADQPVYALNTDIDDETALGGGELAIAAVAARLRARLVAFQPEGPYRLAGWCRWGIVAYELARQLRDEGHEVAFLVLLDAAHPRDGLRLRLRRWFDRDRRNATEAPSFSQRVEAAMHRYRPPAYDGDVLLVLPLTDPGDGGWRSVVRRLEIARAGGDHVGMVRAPHAATLGALIGQALAVRQEPCPAPRQAASAASG